MRTGRGYKLEGQQNAEQNRWTGFKIEILQQKEKY